MQSSMHLMHTHCMQSPTPQNRCCRNKMRLLWCQPTACEQGKQCHTAGSPGNPKLGELTLTTMDFMGSVIQTSGHTLGAFLTTR